MPRLVIIFVYLQNYRVKNYRHEFLKILNHSLNKKKKRRKKKKRMCDKLYKMFGDKNRPFFDQFFTDWENREDASKWKSMGL